MRLPWRPRPCLALSAQREGYLRTSSEEYTFDLSKSFVHLTNHCLQKHSPDLGKYEEGNTLNFEQFQAYLDEHVPSARVNFRKHLWPRIKVRATYSTRPGVCR